MDTDANVYADWSKFSLSIYQEVSTKLNLGAVSNSAKAVYFPKKTLLTIEMGFRDLILQMHRQIQKLLPIVWIKYNNWPLYTILKQPLWICVHTLYCIFSGVFLKKNWGERFQQFTRFNVAWHSLIFAGLYWPIFIEFYWRTVFCLHSGWDFEIPSPDTHKYLTTSKSTGCTKRSNMQPVKTTLKGTGHYWNSKRSKELLDLATSVALRGLPSLGNSA